MLSLVRRVRDLFFSTRVHKGFFVVVILASFFHLLIEGHHPTALSRRIFIPLICAAGWA